MRLNLRLIVMSWSLAIFSLFSWPLALQAQNCELLEFKQVELQKRLRPTQKFEKLSFIIKDAQVLFYSSETSAVELAKKSLKQLGNCDEFNPIQLEQGCTALVGKGETFVLSAEKIWSHDNIKIDGPWSELAFEFSHLKKQKQCSHFYPWKNQRPFCSLSLPINDQGICTPLCQINLVLNTVPSEKESIPHIKNSRLVYHSRHHYLKLKENLDFLEGENFCENLNSSDRACSLQQSGKGFQLGIEGLATFYLSEGILSAMVETSLGGLCQSWDKQRAIIFKAVGKNSRDYFSFTLGEIPHRVLGLDDFKTLVKELRASQVLLSVVSAKCTLVAQKQILSIEREGQAIFRTESQEHALHALSALTTLELCH